MTPIVQSTKRTISDLEALAISTIEIFEKDHGTVIIENLNKKLKEIVINDRVWPELKSLSRDEQSQLGIACFDLLSVIVRKIKKMP